MNVETAQKNLEEINVFCFYNAAFDPVALIKKYIRPDIQPNPDYYTNAFGTLISPEVLPEILNERVGTVEKPPIPANWHADIAEFGAVLRAIDLTRQPKFVMCELGCAWGCWMNISGTVSRAKGLAVQLIGVEGDIEFISMAKRILAANGFSPEEYSLHHGVIAANRGTALFPVHDPNQPQYGFEPLFDVSAIRKIFYLKTGKYYELQQVSLADTLKGQKRVDLLHVDIQGGEDKLIPASVDLLNDKVAYLFIGTHSRQIEGRMIECMKKAGWILEIERPAILNLASDPTVTVDGVQGWRNPRLLPIAHTEKFGSIEFQDAVEFMDLGEELDLRIKVSNHTDDDWVSSGPNPVNISYHWLDKAGKKTVVFDGVRTQFASLACKMGETKEQIMRIVAPAQSGEYQLVVTLVQEGVEWFSEPDFHAAKRAIIVK